MNEVQVKKQNDGFGNARKIYEKDNSSGKLLLVLVRVSEVGG